MCILTYLPGTLQLVIVISHYGCSEVKRKKVLISSSYRTGLNDKDDENNYSHSSDINNCTPK